MAWAGSDVMSLPARPNAVRGSGSQYERLWSQWPLFVVVAGLLLAAPNAQARTEVQLKQCLAANLPSGDFTQQFKLAQSREGKTLRRLAGTWAVRREADGSRSVLKLSAPTELAGSAYLFARQGSESEAHLYLPATRKSKRVSGSSVARSLFGTGLSAFDLQFVMLGLQGGQLAALGSGTVAGQAVQRWRYTPPALPDLLYDRIELAVSTARCLPLEARFFGGTPWKTLTVSPLDVVAAGQGWRVRRARLDDLRSGETTVLDLAAPAAAASAESFRTDRYFK